ncbi:hypothetical protein DFH06DRAFT_1309908 [Mycena polygramma]|nr:hypothetical protein DFH06DRAFT_1309908 [Mycena polygramma]
MPPRQRQTQLSFSLQRPPPATTSTYATSSFSVKTLDIDAGSYVGPFEIPGTSTQPPPVRVCDLNELEIRHCCQSKESVGTPRLPHEPHPELEFRRNSSSNVKLDGFIRFTQEGLEILSPCGLTHPRQSEALGTPSSCSGPSHGADRFIRTLTIYYSAQPDTEIALGPPKNAKVTGTKFGWFQLEAGNEKRIGTGKFLETHKDRVIPIPKHHAKS